MRLAFRRVAVAVTTASALWAAAPAGAAINWYPKQCSGFAGCTAAGLGNAGYEKEYLISHWGMYAGHNCTNYAAYRLMAAGIDASYLQGRGMAYRWGVVAAGEGIAVDGQPKVGDIAWFDSAAGMSASGHVAYVEEVDLAKGRVRVSEDNWSSDFDWRYYDIADVTGFIHFADGPMPAPPASAVTTPSPVVARLTVPPLVTGTRPAVTVTWTGAAAYQVQRRTVSVSATGARLYSPPTDWFSRTTGTRGTFTGAAGAVYQFRVRGIDALGGLGTWSGWQTATLPVDERAGVVTGGWTSGSSASYYAGTFRYTTRPGASFTITGRTDRVTIHGPKARGTGRFSVIIDGINRGTVDTYRSSTAYRQPLASYALPYGQHTVKVVNQGTTGRPYLYLDAVSLRR